MTQKKHSADWYLAFTHYLTAGFVIPAVVGFAFVFLSIPLVGMGPDGTPANPALTLPMNILSVAVGLFSVWLGVKYSASYLKKTYDLSHARRVVHLATLYFVVIGLLFEVGTIWGDYSSGVSPGEMVIYAAIDLLVSALGAGVFYYESRRRLL